MLWNSLRIGETILLVLLQSVLFDFISYLLMVVVS